ncbi:MAG TPA: DinB family protein [Bryobacteraceae bacterium]|jgi:uncharacterized damage-inducible protein DinB|nr:DinB family protein [Bryobacteraceae bacterium]
MRHLCCLFLLGGAGLLAQNPLTDSVTARYKSIRENLVAAAEAMPEDGYQFKLTPAQRSFGGWIGHVAMGNYHFCAIIKGEVAPENPGLHELTEKAALVKAISDSFAYCDAALLGMTDQKALSGVTVAGKTVYPVEGMIGLIASTNEHYGNLVGYLRTKGITPPSSRKR